VSTRPGWCPPVEKEFSCGLLGSCPCPNCPLGTCSPQTHSQLLEGHFCIDVYVSPMVLFTWHHTAQHTRNLPSGHFCFQIHDVPAKLHDAASLGSRRLQVTVSMNRGQLQEPSPCGYSGTIKRTSGSIGLKWGQLQGRDQEARGRAAHILCPPFSNS
jgi:hypothetical protein